MNTGMMNGLSGGPSATVFNIQRFFLHDGPGIRVTVFLKGCPLSCIWCHNPESQRPDKELLFDAGKCKACGLCAVACRFDAMNSRTLPAMSLPGQKGEPDRSTCTACGACVTVCPTGLGNPSWCYS